MFNPEYIPYIWLIVGCACIAVEAFGVPGLGFLFSGLSALTVGMLISFGIVGEDSYALQAALFLAFTGLWALALWNRLYSRNSNGQGEVDDVIGKRAIVLPGGLKRGEKGRVYWSGTHFPARIADSVEWSEIEEGTEVKILDIRGNVLIVEPGDDFLQL